MTDWIRRSWDDVHILQMLGPLFLLLTFMLAPAANTELLLAAVLGLFLCIRGGARGCTYALILVALVAIGKHTWLEANHLWQLGFEASVATALLVTTLGVDVNASERAASVASLTTKETTIAHLEDELAQQRSESARAQAAMLEKLQVLTQTLEEAQAETASLQVLNEVLRQTSAKAALETEKLQREELQNQRRIGDLFQEIDALQKELQRIGNESQLAQQNRDLFKELNAARMAQAQAEQDAAARAGESQVSAQLRQQLSTAQAELEMAENHVEKLMEQIQLSGGSQQEIIALREERALLAERLVLLQQELDAKPAAATSAPAEAQNPTQVDQLYRQLRTQFEEKGQQLHQVRAELFQADNELQTLRRELAQKALEEEAIPKVAQEAIASIDEERLSLVADNKLLEDLVSHLMGAQQAPRAKRASDLPAQQEQLF